MPAPLPEPPHRTGEPLRELHLALRDRPVQRGAQVVVFFGQAVQPESLTRPRKMRGNLLGECEVGQGMAARMSLPSPRSSRRSAANIRTVDNSRNRVPRVDGAGCTRLWSTSEEMPSRTSTPSSSGGPATASASGRPKLPPKTDSRSADPARDSQQVVAPADGALQRPLALGGVARSRAGRRGCGRGDRRCRAREGAPSARPRSRYRAAGRQGGGRSLRRRRRPRPA